MRTFVRVELIFCFIFLVRIVVVNAQVAVTCPPAASFIAPDGCNVCYCSVNGDTAGIHCTQEPCLAAEKKCIPGTQFPATDGCNNCICPPSGLVSEAPCTKNACARDCEPGTSFTASDGCNVCLCPQSGIKREATCTKRQCSPATVCTPGETYSPDGCNLCQCNGHGQPEQCTLIACKPGFCVPGIQFKRNGNTCVCPASGVLSEAACTKIVSCQASQTESLQQTCVPGEVFPADDGCNNCTCPQNGDRSQAACTLMACPQVCVPGVIFSPDGCNRCSCNSRGQPAGCTRSVCPSELCIPGRKFMIDCNTCVCPESGNKTEAICTEIDCFSANQTCTPGESFSSDGCNSCMCDEYGQPAGCTKLTCPPGMCTPGVHFKIDCNSCVCPASGNKSEAACTEMACLPEKQTCTPGVSYSPDGCNTCECNEHGQSGACTLKVCDQDTCTPGTYFKIDCNSCVCPQNGNKSEAACTALACPGPDVPEYPSNLTCNANIKYTDGCNICYCGPDGLLLACTEHICAAPPSSPLPFPSCCPNKPFQVDCANCVCGNSGIPRYCSYSQCRQNETVEICTETDAVTTTTTTTTVSPIVR